MKLFTKLLAAAALLLSSQASFSASFTAADGNTWLQFADTNSPSISYGAIASACSGTGGECTGTVGNAFLGTDIDLTGYTWASNAAVKNMFSAYASTQGVVLSVPNPYTDPAGFVTFAGANVAFGGLKGSGYFTAFTGSGLSGSISSNPFANLGLVGYGSSTLTDLLANTFLPIATIQRALSFSGAYLYKPSASAVPVPAALFLFAPALLGFFGLRRKAQA